MTVLALLNCRDLNCPVAPTPLAVFATVLDFDNYPGQIPWTEMVTGILPRERQKCTPLPLVSLAGNVVCKTILFITFT